MHRWYNAPANGGGATGKDHTEGCSMFNAPRMVAGLLFVAALGWLMAVGAFVLAGRAAGKIDAPATVLGLGVFTFLPALLMLVFGVAAWRMGTAAARQAAEIALERGVLERLSARGELFLPQVAAEMHTSLDALREAVYRIAGKNLLTGYVNWQEQKLYSREAEALNRAGTCPSCGGKLELAGKGVIRCPYCGSEVFLPLT